MLKRHAPKIPASVLGVGRAGVLVAPGGSGNTAVAPSSPPTGGPSEPGPENVPGAALTLTHLTWRSSEADGTSAADGVTLEVPPGQSVALHSVPPGDATELLNIVAGLRRPRSGHVRVDDVAVEQLTGPALDDYVASRGLLYVRLPLVPWLSAADNVLRMNPRLVLAEDPTPGLDSRDATAVLDLLMDVHAQFGFTLLLAIGRQATASRCQRLVRLVGAAVVEDELIKDDPWTRDRIDRIG